MATIEKPQYHSPKQYPQDRQVYQVNPERTDFTRPSGVPDTMFAVSNVMDTLINGLGQYQEIYEQSQNTANQLQAKSLIIDKIKDTQRIKELIATEFPNTSPENLNLKDVLEKYRLINSDGETELYVGANLEHRISPLQMPDDLNDEVKSMIEDHYVREEVGIVSSILTQVEATQSAQTQAILENNVTDFENNYRHLSLNTKIPYDRKKVLEPLLTNLFAEVDNLGHLGTWPSWRIANEKSKIIQTALAIDFQRDRAADGIGTKQAIEKADKGLYRYKHEGKWVYLSPSVIKPFLENQITQENRKSEVKAENKLIDEANVIWEEWKTNPKLAPRLTLLFDDNNKLKNPKDWEKIYEHSKQVGGEHISDVDRIRFAYNKKLEAEGGLEEEERGQVASKVADILLEFTKDPTSISEYSITKNGKLKAISDDDLRKKTGNKYIKSDFISKYLIHQYEQEKSHQAYAKKIYKESIINYFERKQAFENGSGKFLLSIADVIKNEKGEERWVLQDDKILQNKELQYYMYNDLLGQDPDGTTKVKGSKSLRLAVMKNAINGVFSRAIAAHDAQRGDMTVMGDSYFNNTFMGSVRAEYLADLGEKIGIPISRGQDGRKMRRVELKNMSLSKHQLALLQVYEDKAKGLVEMGQQLNQFSISDLKAKVDEVNGVEYRGNEISSLANTLSKALSDRSSNLLKRGTEIGLMESSLHNRKVFEEGVGQYDMKEYEKFMRKMGIFNSSKIVPEGVLETINGITDKELEEEDRIQILNNLSQEVFKYKGFKVQAHRHLLRALTARLGRDWSSLFSKWYGTPDIQRMRLYRDTIQKNEPINGTK